MRSKIKRKLIDYRDTHKKNSYVLLNWSGYEPISSAGDIDFWTPRRKFHRINTVFVNMLETLVLIWIVYGAFVDDTFASANIIDIPLNWMHFNRKQRCKSKQKCIPQESINWHGKCFWTRRRKYAREKCRIMHTISPIRWNLISIGFVCENLHLTWCNQECVACYCVQHDKTILWNGQKFFIRVANCAG